MSVAEPLVALGHFLIDMLTIGIVVVKRRWDRLPFVFCSACTFMARTGNYAFMIY